MHALVEAAEVAVVLGGLHVLLPEGHHGQLQRRLVQRLRLLQQTRRWKHAIHTFSVTLATLTTTVVRRTGQGATNFTN